MHTSALQSNELPKTSQPRARDAPKELTWSCATVGLLLSKSAFSMVAESSFHIALLIETALIVRTLGSESLAIFGAVCATIQFILGLFNFLLVTTLSQVGLAVGAKRWHEIGPRFHLAFSSAVFIGCICALTLFFGQNFVFRLMALGRDDPALLHEARCVMSVRIITVPFIMIQKVCSGFLGGYQRIKTMAFFTAILGLTEVLSQVIVLIVLKMDLVAASVGTVLSSVFGALLALLLVVLMPPDQAEGKIELFPQSMRCWKNIPSEHANDVVNPNVSIPQALSPRSTSSLRSMLSLSLLFSPSARDYVKASSDTIMRSILISSAVYSATIVTANFGTALLAAHKITHDFWHTMAVVVDGLAVVGQMLGSKLIGDLSSSGSDFEITVPSMKSIFNGTPVAQSPSAAGNYENNDTEHQAIVFDKLSSEDNFLRTDYQSVEDSAQIKSQQPQKILRAKNYHFYCQQIFVLRDMLTILGALVGAAAGLGLMMFKNQILAYLFPQDATWLLGQYLKADSTPLGHVTHDLRHQFVTSSAVPGNDISSTIQSHIATKTDVHTTVSLLLAVWPLISSMQIINSIVFVFDGLVFAAQAFRYARNVMVCAVLGWFLPMLVVCSRFLSLFEMNESLWHRQRNPLITLWMIMSGVSFVRVAGGFIILYWKLPRRWVRYSAKK